MNVWQTVVHNNLDDKFLESYLLQETVILFMLNV